MGIWPGHRGYTLLFTRSAMGFLMNTESQDLGFYVSSERRMFAVKLVGLGLGVRLRA